MSVSINLPEELYAQARSIGEAHHVPIDEVFASAFADQFAAWLRLRERAARSDREKFLSALDKVPDVEPEEYDRI